MQLNSKNFILCASIHSSTLAWKCVFYKFPFFNSSTQYWCHLILFFQHLHLYHSQLHSLQATYSSSFPVWFPHSLIRKIHKWRCYQAIHAPQYPHTWSQYQTLRNSIVCDIEHLTIHPWVLPLALFGSMWDRFVNLNHLFQHSRPPWPTIHKLSPL